MSRQLSIWLLTALALCVLPACGERAKRNTDPGDGTLRVGVILPMSGDNATYGEESWNGILLAQRDLEQAGLPTLKINGKDVVVKLALDRRDETSQKSTGATQAKALIETALVHVVLGSVASSVTKAIFQEAKESEVPCISPASTNDTLTNNGGPYTSRICFQDSFQGAVLARFALSKGWKKAAVVIDKKQDYSVGLAENFEKVFTAAGGTVSKHYYVTEDSDFSNVVQAAADEDADVIFISGYYAQAGPMIKQAKEKWAGKPIIGGDGLDSPDLVGLVGDTNAEIYLTSHFAADAPDEAVQAFAKRYKDEYGKAPGAMAALGYDVMVVLLDAIKRAKNPYDPASLAKAIANTKNVKGITGVISLDNPSRTPVKDAVIVKVEGSLKFHKKIAADAK